MGANKTLLSKLRKAGRCDSLCVNYQPTSSMPRKCHTLEALVNYCSLTSPRKLLSSSKARPYAVQPLDKNFPDLKLTHRLLIILVKCANQNKSINMTEFHAPI